jgi:hypothetical protein
MPTTAQLKATTDALEALTSVRAGNRTETGWWRRIALALEEAAGAATTANPTREGWMLRAAVAAEAVWGGSGAEENRTFEGLLKRLVDALEINAGVGTGSRPNRLSVAAALITLADAIRDRAGAAITDRSGSTIVARA